MSTRDHASLPLRGCDHLPLPSLAQRIRSLGRPPSSAMPEPTSSRGSTGGFRIWTFRAA